MPDPGSDSPVDNNSDFSDSGSAPAPPPPWQKKVKKIPDKKIEAISPTELTKEIKGKTKIKKAPGLDHINGLILKNFR